MLNPGDDRLNNAMFNSYLNQASYRKRFYKTIESKAWNVRHFKVETCVSSGQYET